MPLILQGGQHLNASVTMESSKGLAMSCFLVQNRIKVPRARASNERLLILFIVSFIVHHKCLGLLTTLEVQFL